MPTLTTSWFNFLPSSSDQVRSENALTVQWTPSDHMFLYQHVTESQSYWKALSESLRLRQKDGTESAASSSGMLVCVELAKHTAHRPCDRDKLHHLLCRSTVALQTARSHADENSSFGVQLWWQRHLLLFWSRGADAGWAWGDATAQISIPFPPNVSQSHLALHRTQPCHWVPLPVRLLRHFR